jgi:integrase
MNQVVRDVLSGLQFTAGRNVLVFVSRKTGRVIQDVKKSFRAACDEAGLMDFRFHDLRHTAGTRLGDTGADPFVIGNDGR